MERRSAEWVNVAEFTNHPQAELARNVLEGHDIPVHIWADDCGGVAAGQTFVQRVRLLVPPECADEARTLLGSPPGELHQ